MGKLFLLVHDLGVNHAFVLLFVVGFRLAAFRLRLRLAFFSLRLCRSRLVKLGGNRLPDFVQFFARSFDGRGVRAFERFLHVRNGLLYLGLVVAGNLVGVVLEHLFGAIHRAVRLVARLDLLAFGLVLVGVRLGVLAHLLDFVLREAAAGRDGDLLFLARAEVLGAHVQNAV